MGEKLKYLQSVFNKGELSPRLKGRVDNRSYYNAYEEGNNLIPFAEGSITFRPGTVYVNEVKTSTKNTRIVSFRFSTIQNYVIEVGDQYFRFYRNRGLVESSPGTPYEVASPYLEADLDNIKFLQSADVLYILHPDYQPRQLVRTSDTNWTLSTLDFIDGPYYPINSTATTFAVTSTTLTASTSTFVSSDVGRKYRIKSGSAWHYGEITGFTNATTVTVTKTPSGNVGATIDWRLGVFGGNQGWPAVGSIFEERLILARTANNPATIWGSVTGDFTKFQPSSPADGAVADDDGFAFTIGDDQGNSINWVSSGRQLLIGTTGGEYTMTGGSSSGYTPITPSNVTIKRESNYGSKQNVSVQRVGNAVLYPSFSGRKIREMYYEFGVDSYISRDTTIFSRHILEGVVKDTCYVQEPDPHLWVCDNSGLLIGMIYERLQEVEGWHKHKIAGTDAKVLSVCSIPKPGDEADDLWLVVERTIDGSTVKYIEYLSEIHEDVRAPIDNVDKKFYAKFLDSCITYDGFYGADLTLGAVTGTGVTVTASASVFSSGDVGSRIKSGNGLATVTAYTNATTITVDVTSNFSGTSITKGNWSMQSKSFSGLDHLEGETVSIVADGYVTDDEVASSGAITIEAFASVVHVGLSYKSNIKFLLPEFPQKGTIQGREKSVSRVHLYLTDTYGLKIKDTISDTTYPIKFLELPLQTEGSQPLYNGLLSFHPPSGYERDSQLELVHDLPLPFTLNYIIQDLDVTN